MKIHFRRIKPEYYILFLAWTFWAIADGLSWNFYDTSFEICIIAIVKSVHLIFTSIYSFATVAVFIWLQNISKNKIFNIVIYCIGIIAVSSLATLTNYNSSLYMNKSPLEIPELKKFLMLAFFKIIYFTGFTTLFFTIRKNRELQHEKNKALVAQNMATTAQLQMLQEQVNPHFLFNALNSLRSLIVQNPVQARDMVTYISEFLRETLQPENKGSITLSQEIELLENYLSIQKIRFGKDLEIKYDIDKNFLKSKVPAFILQPLAENAIKHGMRSDSKLFITVTIKTQAEELVFSVVNNGSLQKLEHGNGNTNIIRRLELLYKSNAHFNLYEQDGNVHSEIKINLKYL